MLTFLFFADYADSHTWQQITEAQNFSLPNFTRCSRVYLKIERQYAEILQAKSRHLFQDNGLPRLSKAGRVVLAKYVMLRLCAKKSALMEKRTRRLQHLMARILMRKKLCSGYVNALRFLDEQVFYISQTALNTATKENPPLSQTNRPKGGNFEKQAKQCKQVFQNEDARRKETSKEAEMTWERMQQQFTQGLAELWARQQQAEREECSQNEEAERGNATQKENAAWEEMQQQFAQGLADLWTRQQQAEREECSQNEDAARGNATQKENAAWEEMQQQFAQGLADIWVRQQQAECEECSQNEEAARGSTTQDENAAWEEMQQQFTQGLADILARQQRERFCQDEGAGRKNITQTENVDRAMIQQWIKFAHTPNQDSERQQVRQKEETVRREVEQAETKELKGSWNVFNKGLQTIMQQEEEALRQKIRQEEAFAYEIMRSGALSIQAQHKQNQLLAKEGTSRKDIAQEERSARDDISTTSRTEYQKAEQAYCQNEEEMGRNEAEREEAAAFATIQSKLQKAAARQREEQKQAEPYRQRAAALIITDPMRKNLMDNTLFQITYALSLVQNKLPIDESLRQRHEEFQRFLKPTVGPKPNRHTIMSKLQSTYSDLLDYAIRLRAFDLLRFGLKPELLYSETQLRQEIRDKRTLEDSYKRLIPAESTKTKS